MNHFLPKEKIKNKQAQRLTAGLARAVTFGFQTVVRVKDYTENLLSNLRIKTALIPNLKNEQKQKSTAGFAILFAVLISSLLMVLGFTIFNITVKELTISGFTSESKQAIFAAKSGIDCVFYWKSKGKLIEGSGDWGGLSCAGGAVEPKSGTDGPTVDVENDLTSSPKNIAFWVYYDLTNKEKSPCSLVNIKLVKDENTEDNEMGLFYFGTLDVKGYNICDMTSKRLVERSYQISIQ